MFDGVIVDSIGDLSRKLDWRRRRLYVSVSRSWFLVWRSFSSRAGFLLRAGIGKVISLLLSRSGVWLMLSWGGAALLRLSEFGRLGRGVGRLLGFMVDRD